MSKKINEDLIEDNDGYIDEHEYEIHDPGGPTINWRRIELIKEKKWLKEQLKDYGDWNYWLIVFNGDKTMTHQKLPKLSTHNWERLMDYDLTFDAPHATTPRMIDENKTTEVKRRVRQGFHRARWG